MPEKTNSFIIMIIMFIPEGTKSFIIMIILVI